MFSPVKMIVTYPFYHMIEKAVFTSRTFEKTWDSLRPKLEKGIDLVAGEVHPLAPSFIHKYLYQEPTMRRLVAECMKEMYCSDIMALYTQVQKIRRDVAKRKLQILEWEKDMLSAPKKSWNPLDFTQNKLKGKVYSAQTRVNSDERQIDELIERSVVILKKRGVTLSRDQIDALLKTAEGEDIASIMAVADTVKLIFNRLEQQLTDHPSAELSKVYAGFYMMFNRIYLEAVEKAIFQIDRKYIPAIEKIRIGAQVQITKAQNHIGRFYSTDNHRSTLKANIEINERTLEASQFYLRYLHNQAKDLFELREKAKQNYEVSLNTFLTMKMGASLVDIIRASQADLSRVFDFTPPNISALCSSGVLDQFAQIAQEIKRK